MTQPPATPSPSALRTEFAQCAEDARAVMHVTWQAVYIFLSAIILGLAVVTAQLINRGSADHDWLTFGLVLVLGVVGGAMALGLILIQRRQQWLLAITYERMRQIEWQLGMRKNISIHVLDNWGDEEQHSRLSPDDQQILIDLLRQHPRPRLYGGTVIRSVAGFTIFGWLGLVLAEFAVALWNQLHAGPPAAPMP